jgi:hypothetical protein
VRKSSAWHSPEATGSPVLYRRVALRYLYLGTAEFRPPASTCPEVMCPYLQQSS